MPDRLPGWGYPRRRGGLRARIRRFVQRWMLIASGQLLDSGTIDRSHRRVRQDRQPAG